MRLIAELGFAAVFIGLFAFVLSGCARDTYDPTYIGVKQIMEQNNGRR